MSMEYDQSQSQVVTTEQLEKMGIGVSPDIISATGLTSYVLSLLKIECPKHADRYTTCQSAKDAQQRKTQIT